MDSKVKAGGKTWGLSPKVRLLNILNQKTNNIQKINKNKLVKLVYDDSEIILEKS